MSEMIERVARAMALRRAELMLWADPATQTIDERELARVAMEAMREPTKGMERAGGSIGDWAEGMPQSKARERAWENRAAKEVWQAMIDAALGDAK